MARDLFRPIIAGAGGPVRRHGFGLAALGLLGSFAALSGGLWARPEVAGAGSEYVTSHRRPNELQ